MQGTGKITFPVLPGRWDPLLLPDRGPEEANFGVQVDIDFINIEDFDTGLGLREPLVDRLHSLGGIRVTDP